MPTKMIVFLLVACTINYIVSETQLKTVKKDALTNASPVLFSSPDARLSQQVPILSNPRPPLQAPVFQPKASQSLNGQQARPPLEAPITVPSMASPSLNGQKARPPLEAPIAVPSMTSPSLNIPRPRPTLDAPAALPPMLSRSLNGKQARPPLEAPVTVPSMASRSSNGPRPKPPFEVRVAIPSNPSPSLDSPLARPLLEVPLSPPSMASRSLNSHQAKPPLKAPVTVPIKVSPSLNSLQARPPLEAPVSVPPMASQSLNGQQARPPLEVPVTVPSMASPALNSQRARPALETPVAMMASKLNHSSSFTFNTSKAGPPVVESAHKKTEDAMILKIDNLARGVGRIFGMETPTKLSDCKAEYKVVNSPKLTFKMVVDDIFQPGSLPLREALRGFVDPSKFDFKTVQQLNASIVVSYCGKERKMKFLNFKSLTPNAPVRWMTLEETTVNTIEMRYDEIVNQKVGTAWDAMGIKGVGKVRIGKEGSMLNDKQYLIAFEKNMTNPNGELVDSDVKIFIHNTVIDRYEIKASDFLAMHGQEASDLYPKDSDMTIDCMTNEELTIAQKHGNDPIIKGSISDKNIYSVYATGEVKLCDDLKGSNVDIICQNDFRNNVNCALIALIDTTNTSQYQDFQKSGLNNVGNIIFTDLAENAHLFNGRIPDRLLFQTSKNAIDQLNSELVDKLYPYIINENKRDPEMPSQPDIIGDFCFRYKLDNIGTKYPNLRNSLNVQMLVNACPGTNFVKFYLPDVGLVAIDQIPLLITSFEQEAKFRDCFKEQRLAISSIEARESDVEVGAYKYIFNLQPPGYKFAKAFAFLTKFPFLKIEDSPITLTRDVSPQVTFAGCGSEKILGNIAKFKFEQDNLGTFMTVNLETTSSYHLVQAFKDVKSFPLIDDETNKERYITPFEPLGQITLLRLGATAHACDESLSIVGDALMGNESNVSFELHLTYTPESKVKGRSCVFKRDGILADFINEARGDEFVGQSWLKYKTIGLMFLPSDTAGREDCDMDPCCIADPANQWKEIGNNKSVGVKIVDIAIESCGEIDARSDIRSDASDASKFLKRVFKDRQSINVILTGSMTNESLSVCGQTENEMMLGPDVLMSGTPPIEVKFLVEQTKGMKRDSITFKGWLTFQNNSGSNFLTRIIVTGQIITLQILSGNDELMPVPDIFTTAFVRLSDTSSRRVCIPPTKNLTEIELNAPMKVGYSLNDQLLFDDPNSVKLFINAKTGKASRFYACRDSKKPVPIRELLNAFNGFNVYGLLDNTMVKSLCVTYHQKKTRWNITELGLNVKPGLRISGLLASHFGKRHPKGETFHLKTEMDLSIEETTSLFCVILPPLEWGVQKRNVEGRTVEIPTVGMYYCKKSQTQGPKYCFKLPKQTGGLTEAFMEGFIKTFAFESMAKIRITTPDPRFPGNLFRYTLNYNERLFNESKGRLRMEANYTGQDPFKLNFKITIDQFKLDSISQSVSAYMKRRLDQVSKLREKADCFYNKFSKWEKDVNDSLGKIKKEMSKQKDEFTKVKYERARAVQAFKKVCSNECGYVRVPGWKPNEQWGKASNGGTLRTVDYVEDAHVASNVGCVASCEAVRVKALEEAVKLDTITRTEGCTLDKRKTCFQTGSKLREKLQEIKCFLDNNKDQFRKKAAKFKSLNNTDANRYKILNLRMTTFVDDVKDLRCFRFDWESHWDWDRRADEEWGVSKRRQIFTNITQCFNGFFTKNITEYTMDKRYLVNELMKLEKQVNSVEGKYIIFEKIFNRTGGNPKSREINLLEKEFDECEGNKTAVKRTARSVIDTISPIKSGIFTIFLPSTVEAFNKRSPWQIAGKRDALTSFAQFERKSSVAPAYLFPRNESTCSVIRRATIDYSDIASYIRKWIREQQTAKRTLANVRSTLLAQVKKVDEKIERFQANLSTDNTQLLKYWSGQAKLGLARWMLSEEEQLSRYNNESMPLIRKELEFVYTNQDYPTLEDFFQRRSLDASTALKKAKIESPDGNSFMDVQKTIMKVLRNSSSLDQFATPVNDAIQRIESLQKRAMLCLS